MKIYCISGLGANEKVYERLNLSEKYSLVCLPWILPLKNETLENYALRISINIDTTEDFIIMGLSFGGIMAQEIAKIKPPKKLILLSTIKNENEKPFWISINNYIPFYRLFPNIILTSSFLIKIGSKIRKAIYHQSLDLNAIYTFRENEYLNWAFRNIIKWKNIEFDHRNTLHIHGTRDIIFPFGKIKNATKINKGTHMLIHERAEEVSEIINLFRK